mmetsp:Transcript_758/g.2283  ORF Transcript_758/g.2283 Transcript_758/m.2283 type:complete len:343 (+) Transcript_758:86-1114(+)
MFVLVFAAITALSLSVPVEGGRALRSHRGLLNATTEFAANATEFPANATEITANGTQITAFSAPPAKAGPCRAGVVDQWIMTPLTKAVMNSGEFQDSLPSCSPAPIVNFPDSVSASCQTSEDATDFYLTFQTLVTCDGATNSYGWSAALYRLSGGSLTVDSVAGGPLSTAAGATSYPRVKQSPAAEPAASSLSDSSADTLIVSSSDSTSGSPTPSPTDSESSSSAVSPAVVSSSDSTSGSPTPSPPKTSEDADSAKQRDCAGEVCNSDESSDKDASNDADPDDDDGQSSSQSDSDSNGGIQQSSDQSDSDSDGSTAKGTSSDAFKCVAPDYHLGGTSFLAFT